MKRSCIIEKHTGWLHIDTRLIKVYTQNSVISLSLHSWHSVFCVCTRLSRRPNSNIHKPHIGRKVVHDVKWCMVIFFPQSYWRSQTELYDDRSAFCRGQWICLYAQYHRLVQDCYYQNVFKGPGCMNSCHLF